MTADDFAAQAQTVAELWRQLQEGVPTDVRTRVGVLQEDFARYLVVFEAVGYDVAQLQRGEALTDYLESRDRTRINAAARAIVRWSEEACDYTPRGDGPFVAV